MGEEFSNLQVDLGNLPSVEEIAFTGLHKDYLLVGIISNLIFWILAAGGVLIGVIAGSDSLTGWMKTGVFILFLGLMGTSLALKIFGFRRKLYALRERDIVYKKGLIWRSSVVIPFNRIQHAEVFQGPLDRLFDLSSLRIYTAGGSSSDLSIPGLRPSVADKIKHYVLSKTSSYEEE